MTITIRWKMTLLNGKIHFDEVEGGFYLNKSGKEIANDLGMSSDNVRMALVRAKRKAHQAMEDWKHSTNQAK